MSSFLIDRIEYIKAGAFLGYFAQNSDTEPYIYKYLYNEGRLAKQKDIINMFIDLYNINAQSINDQYGDESKTTDYELTPEERISVGNYTRIAKDMLMMSRRETTKSLLALHHFLRSVNYQIEGKHSDKAWKILTELSWYMLNVVQELNKDYDEHNWGEFNLQEVKY